MHHLRCYKQFTDITKIARAVKRNAKKRQAIPDDEGEPQRKSARLEKKADNKSNDQQSQRRLNFLHEACIISKDLKYRKDPHSKVRRKESLCKWESMSGK